MTALDGKHAGEPMIFGHGIEQGSNALRAAPVGFVDEQKSVLPDGLLGGLLQLPFVREY